MLGLDDVMPNTDGKTTCAVLIEKYTSSRPACPDCLLPDHQTKPNPIIYDNLDAGCIRNAALHTHGAAGLSGLDAYAWRRLCSSFQSLLHDLCKALAAVGRRLCTSIINPAYLSVHAMRGLSDETQGLY